MDVGLFPSIITAPRVSGLPLAPTPADGFLTGSLGVPSPDVLCRILFIWQRRCRHTWELGLCRLRLHREQALLGSVQILESPRECISSSCGKINEPFTSTPWTPVSLFGFHASGLYFYMQNPWIVLRCTQSVWLTQQLLRGMLRSATKPIVLTEQTRDAFKIE